jgi:large subunit ribosomal protein L5
MLRLKEKYNKEVIAALKEKFGYKSVSAAPRITKVVVNTSFGRLVGGKSKQEAANEYKDILEDLALITSQRPVLTEAKKSISAFKIREGFPVGAMVTLRKQKMYDILERLIHIVLPRTRDFTGLNPNSVDKDGNLTVGIKEQIVFPEISAERAKRMFGFEITVVTSAKNREEGLELFKLLGFPIKNNA